MRRLLRRRRADLPAGVVQGLGEVASQILRNGYGSPANQTGTVAALHARFQINAIPSAFVRARAERGVRADALRIYPEASSDHP